MSAAEHISGDLMPRDTAPRTTPRVLVIEDEQDLQEVLQWNLRQTGYEVIGTSSGREGLRLILEERPDVVLLDLMLPDLPGTEICKLVKQNPATRHIPVIMVTAKGDELDRVVGFEIGAADYVVKPFSVRELVLRVRAVLQRGEPAPPTQGMVRLGRLRIDRDAHRVWVDGDEVLLTSIEYRLLLTLYERRNRVQPRAALLQDVWNASSESSSRTIDTHVKRLRAKLGPVGSYIRTIRGVGYRFRSEVEEEPGG
jgi:two-component system phosphate regulon response regulator PhoB